MSDERKDGEEEGARHRGTSERLISNLFRRTRSTAQHTEDVLRGVIGDLKLPKEVVTYILETVDGTRREIVRVAAREVREFLESANITEEISRMLTTLTFEVRTEIRFVPNQNRLSPRTRSEVHVRQRGEAPAGDQGASDDEDAEAEPAGPRDPRLSETLEEILRAGTSELGEMVQRFRRERTPAAGAETAREDASSSSASTGAGPAPRREPASSAAASAPVRAASGRSDSGASSSAREGVASAATQRETAKRETEKRDTAKRETAKRETAKRAQDDSTAPAPKKRRTSARAAAPSAAKAARAKSAKPKAPSSGATTRDGSGEPSTDED